MASYLLGPDRNTSAYAEGLEDNLGSSDLLAAAPFADSSEGSSIVRIDLQEGNLNNGLGDCILSARIGLVGFDKVLN